MDPVFIIILNFNGEADTIACIESLLSIHYRTITICVFDNGSKAESVSRLQQYFCEVQKYFDKFIDESYNNISYNYTIEQDKRNFLFFRNTENLGFAAGNNAGINVALQNGFEYVLLLNNDTLVEPDFLNKMMEFITTHPQYVALTPKICYERLRNKIWNCGGHLTWFKNRKYFYADAFTDQAPQTGFGEISFITGCCLLFNPKKIGLLSENFFFGEEDFEFSLRIKQQKKKMACKYDAVIYHKVGHSISNVSNTFGKAKLHYINRFIDIKNYYPYTWKLWFLLNGIYAFFLLLCKYKIEIKKNLLFWCDVYKTVKVKNRVSKSDFFTIINFENK